MFGDFVERRLKQATNHYAAINLELRQTGKPIPTNDLWIAALCRQHDLPLLSRDRHFDAVSGIQIVPKWDGYKYDFRTLYS